MYTVDRRKIARHVYSMINSLRRTATLLQVSHSSVARWIRRVHPKQYDTSNRQNKGRIVSECVRSAIFNNPFLSYISLQTIVQQTFGFSISKQLARTVIKRLGFSKKKPRCYGHPPCMQEKVQTFLRQRDSFVLQNKRFISLDETSFGRNVKDIKGYTKKGIPLYIKRTSRPRITTTSALVAINGSDNSVHAELKEGAFNTGSFLKSISTFSFQKDDVLLLDNVAFHHSKSVHQFARDKGLHLLYVPPYSPWFNPIEGVFSIIKRRYYQTFNVNTAFEDVSERHIQAFFHKSFCTRSSPDGPTI